MGGLGNPSKKLLKALKARKLKKGKNLFS